MNASSDCRPRGKRAGLPLAIGLAVLACVVLVAPRVCSATSLEITPYAGYAWWDDQLKWKDHPHFGGKLGVYFGILGIEGNFGLTSTRFDTTFAAGISNKLKIRNYGGDLVLRFVKEGKVVPYILGGVGVVNVDAEQEGFTDTTRISFDAGAGLLFKLSRNFGLRFEGRDLMYKLPQEQIDIDQSLRNNIIATGGLSFIFGGSEKDTDRDKVPDSRDECPDTPLGAVVDARGCPVDSDKDGVPDGIDQCPDTPAGATVDAKGCPMDSDKDGVFDGIDQCPDTPAGVHVDAKGCPKDSDGDGVTDDKDLCPNTQQGVKVDKDGCPIEITEREQEMLDKGSITVRNIHFDTAKWDILPESEPVLNELGKIFIQWPQLQIEIGGHTDARGSDAYNQDLSEKRANSVREWLIAHYPQINAANFTAKGYGESKPIATNKTQTGMAANRRVEFKVLNTEELTKVKERRRTLQQGE